MPVIRPIRGGGQEGQRPWVSHLYGPQYSAPSNLLHQVFHFGRCEGLKNVETFTELSWATFTMLPMAKFITLPQATFTLKGRASD